MSIRVPTDLKNFIWATARKERKSATDVVVDILAANFRGLPPAPKWKPGTTKGARHNEKAKSSSKSDIFA